ncbi:MAG TPA: tyrosine-type recombinase/integrase [Terriglobia bacterium]|nr:tyrosine-type recombinase/integrase [Terriglobia bacterium]
MGGCGFQRVPKRAGVADLRIQDLRHTFALRLLDRGVPDRVVQKLLRHSTPGMTVRYT